MVDTELLKALALNYDQESRPVFLSLYADLSDPKARNALERRAKEIESALDDNEMRHLFLRSWDAARTAFEEKAGEKGSQGVAVFHSTEHELLEALALAAPIKTRLVLDTSPYIRPLARFADEYESFLLVLLDSQDAALFTVSAGKVELEESQKTHAMNKHRSGGMSQRRFQRHREGVLDQFFDEVAERAQEIATRETLTRVVVAGPGQAKNRFMERAPKAFQDLVIAVEDADFSEGATDATLAKEFVGVARDAAAEEAQKELARLKTALRTGDGAVTGALDTFEAAQHGRVATVLVMKDHHTPGRKCEEHQTAFALDSRCHCGADGAKVDLINEAVEVAIRTGCEVEFLPSDPFLEAVGGVAGLLRW